MTTDSTSFVCTQDERELLDRLYQSSQCLRESGIENFDGEYIHFNEVAEACCRAWPDGKDPGFSESPMEYISHLINERDEVLTTTKRLLETCNTMEQAVRFFKDSLLMRQGGWTDEKNMVFRRKWNVPVDQSLDEFARAMVAAALTGAPS